MLEELVMSLTIVSTAFAHGGAIPARHTGQSANVSPELSWDDVPAETKSIVVWCHDPDAPVGDWTHWIVFDLPPDTRRLPEAVPPRPTLPDGSVQGLNDFGKHGYGGPCPPPGRPHRYFFKVYALDVKLGLSSSTRQADLLRALKGHILAEGELMGTFQR
jgi:Raf kinase inhibitor-like YbhB/YbcL family protein